MSIKRGQLQELSTKAIYTAILFVLVWAFIVALDRPSVMPAPNIGLSEVKTPIAAETVTLLPKEEVHVLSKEEIVAAYRSYKPEIKSVEGFMDLLESLHKYSVSSIISQNVKAVTAPGDNLLAAVDEINLETKLPVKEIDRINLIKTTDPSTTKLELHMKRAVVAGLNYGKGFVKLGVNFPKDSTWSIKNIGEIFVLNNINGKPSIEVRLIWVPAVKINAVREFGKFPYRGKDGQKIFLGYFIGEKKEDKNYFGGIDVAPFKMRSYVLKGDKKWPSELPSFSELNNLIAASATAKGKA